MQTAYQFLLTLGSLFLLGLLTDFLGRKTFLPRVTLLLLFGAIIGPDVLNIIPSVFTDRFEIIADMALLMVAFLLGGKLTVSSLKKTGHKILWISITAAFVTTAIVSLGLILIGIPQQMAIILGCIASATAPASIVDIVLESNSNNKFADILLSIVALDDAWGLILFSVGIAIVASINGINTDGSSILLAIKEIGGAILLGITIGLPAAKLTGRVKAGQPMLTEALGLVFLCKGIAIWLEVSFLIASMMMGAVITNFARHHEYPFHAIEGVEWPFMLIFFVLAGASLNISAITDIGIMGIAYILLRTTGKILGARIGSELCNASNTTKKWMGLALLPQAGVAIGMALVAANHFPEYRQILLSTVIATTIFFEIIGPIFTRIALEKAHLKE